MDENAKDMFVKLGDSILEEKTFQNMSRREFLKLLPILAFGGMLFRKLR